MQGTSFIAGGRAKESGGTVHAVNPATGEVLAPEFCEASTDDVHRACEAAWVAFQSYRLLPDARRATFLRAIAGQIESRQEAVVQRGQQETGLPEARLKGELARTCNQLGLFASLLEEGSWPQPRIEHGDPDRKPIPKPDLRSIKRPIGPVAVFCASNFPLAFSVAGGDTASALAAGCPVVVKAHHAHLGVAAIVADAITAAVAECDMPPGVFSMLFGSGRTIGQALVRHPRIKAVGFTGSRAGGRTLMDIAAARPEPIPVYAEMSSVNPIVILPGALGERGESIAKGLHGSVTLGVGQFCTNPGLVFLPAGAAAEKFAATLARLMEDTPTCPMLHSGIRSAYSEGIQQRERSGNVKKLATSDGDLGAGRSHAGAVLFQTTADAYLQDEQLAAEIFGPATLLITYEDDKQLDQLVDSLEGQLTATVHATADDLQNRQRLLAALELTAGRLVFNGYPTGVEVNHAIVHGGPYPATSDGRTTSVGEMAMYRFTRAVAWQDCPDDQLPDALKESNPLGIRRQVDGQWQ